MSGILETEPFMVLYRAVLGTEEIIPASDENIETLKKIAKNVKIGEYGNAFSSSLLLLTDARLRTRFFLEKAIPHMQKSLPLVRDIYAAMGSSSDTDALHEGLNIVNGCRALQGYMEPAEIIVRYIQDLTQKELSEFLKSKERQQLDAREKEAIELVTQYTEQFEREPLPYISAEAEEKVKQLTLESMRKNPNGIPLLAVATLALDEFNKIHGGLFFPRLYGFQVGSRRYASALDMYFK